MAVTRTLGILSLDNFSLVSTKMATIFDEMPVSEEEYYFGQGNEPSQYELMLEQKRQQKVLEQQIRKYGDDAMRVDPKTQYLDLGTICHVRRSTSPHVIDSVDSEASPRHHRVFSQRSDACSRKTVAF
jgi:hypothetical protein